MADPAIAAPPKKKLLFKRTVARKSSDQLSNGARTSKKEDDDDGVSLFRRVDDELPQVLEEQERRVRQKEKRSSASAAIKRDPEDHHVKRRRLSSAVSDEEPVDDGVTRRSDSDRGSVSRSPTKPKILSPALFDDDDIIMDVKGKGKEILRPKDVLQIKKSRQFSPPHVIPLDDGDDDVKIAPSPEPLPRSLYRSPQTRAQRRDNTSAEDDPLPNPFTDSPPASQKPPDDDDDGLEIVDGPQEQEEEPDEFEEYVRRARERAEERERQAKLKLERDSQAKDSQESTPAGQRSFTAATDSNNDSQSPAVEDTIIKIMVTSELPNSRPKVIERKFNQSFARVRDAWASGQDPPVPLENRDLIFLTWKGNRVYGTTTCANLGISVDRIDKSTNKGKLAGAKYAEYGEGNGFHRGGLHLQAWTEELYQDFLKKRERERLRLLGQLDDDEYDEKPSGSGARGSEDPDGGGGGEAEATTKVILKAAKDYEPLRFKVHGQTTVDEMIMTFRQSRKVPEDKEISLFFDGEKLDGDMAVKDTEIEDMDSLEVHIK